MAEVLKAPRVEVTCPTGGATLRIALDSGFLYQVQMMDAILDVAYTETVSWDLELYYEPLTATLVSTALKQWHTRLAEKLTAAFKDAVTGTSPFTHSPILEEASGPLWEAA